MDAEKILFAILGALPTAVAVVLMLKLNDKAADAIRWALARIRKHVAGTKSPIDDALFAPVDAAGLSLARDIEDGKLAGKPAAEAVRDFVSFAKEIAKKK